MSFAFLLLRPGLQSAADLGLNVVQIVGFEDDDWAGSVLNGELTLRSWVGMWEYGRRF